MMPRDTSTMIMIDDDPTKRALSPYRRPTLTRWRPSGELVTCGGCGAEVRATPGVVTRCLCGHGVLVTAAPRPLTAAELDALCNDPVDEAPAPTPKPLAAADLADMVRRAAGADEPLSPPAQTFNKPLTTAQLEQMVREAAGVDDPVRCHACGVGLTGAPTWWDDGHSYCQTCYDRRELGRRLTATAPARQPLPSVDLEQMVREAADCGSTRCCDCGDVLGANAVVFRDGGAARCAACQHARRQQENRWRCAGCGCDLRPATGGLHWDDPAHGRCWCDACWAARLTGCAPLVDVAGRAVTCPRTEIAAGVLSRAACRASCGMSAYTCNTHNTLPSDRLDATPLRPHATAGLPDPATAPAKRGAPFFPQTAAELLKALGDPPGWRESGVGPACPGAPQPHDVVYCEAAPPRAVVEAATCLLDGDEVGAPALVPHLRAPLCYTARMQAAWARHEAHETRWRAAMHGHAQADRDDAARDAFKRYAGRSDWEVAPPAGADAYGGAVIVAPATGKGARCALCGAWLRRAVLP